MREVKSCLILAGAAVLVACATQAPEPATLPAHPVAASAATPTEKLKIPEGYEREVVNGEVRYCRDDVDTGSRLAHTKVCLTAAQLQANQDGSQAIMNQLQNRNGIGATMTGGPQGMGGH
jgi:hypothetical protein